MIPKSFCLDDNHPDIIKLIIEKEWLKLAKEDRIKAIYDFVQNEIYFGYNQDDYLPAHLILKDGYGQCNTKAILLMSLFQACHITCRLHGATVDKSLQKGILSGFIYALSPTEIIHSWVEVYIDNQWYALEGVILDDKYLYSICQTFANQKAYCGYGVAVSDLQNIDVHWAFGDTYIQKEAVKKDLGIFDTPDEFFKDHYQRIGVLKKWLYQHIVRHWMNHKVKQMRSRA